MKEDNYMRPSNLKIIFRYGPLYWIIWLMQRHALASEIKYRALHVAYWITKEAVESGASVDSRGVVTSELAQNHIDFFKELESMHSAIKLFWQVNPIRMSAKSDD